MAVPAVAVEALPTTRDRLHASFDGAASAEPAPAPLVLREEARPTTRSRIVGRALAPPEREPPAPERAAPAVVIDLAAERELRRPRPEPEATIPAGAPASVVVLAPRETLARGPPAPTPVDDAEAAERRPEPEPQPESEPEPAPGPEAVPTAPVSGPAPALEPETAAAESSAPTEAPAAAEPAAEAPPEAQPVQPPATAPPVQEAAPPTPPRAIRNPEDEPGFQAMKGRTNVTAARKKRHQPAEEGAATAQAASAPDARRDVESQAAHEQEERMAAQQPGPFDAEKFKADVKQAIEAMAPPANLEEADEYAESGKAGQAAEGIHGLVAGGRAASEHDIKTATEAPAPVEGKEPKEPAEMVNDRTGAPPQPVGAADAMPAMRPDAEIDLSGGPLEIEARMREANVTDEQLANANEPEFSGALQARDEVREHAATAPSDYRVQEERVLATGRAEAEAQTVAPLEGMHATRAGTLAGVVAAKTKTKSADEQLRDEVNQTILDIHTRTQTEVQAILDSLDTKVDELFTSGEKAARDEFERYVDAEMSAYKADRYGGTFGGARWLKDKLFDLPDEVNRFYVDGRASYLAAMDRVIETIATLVGSELGAAQARIQAGREEVRTYVESLPASLRTLGEDTAANLDSRFEQLSADVDAKRDELVDSVARKYVESRDALDTRIEELKEANKGLVSKAIDAVVGVLKTIYELGKLLLRVLLKAAAAIGDILAHPIRFLDNLVGAVKGGLDRFIERIGVHLQESLLDLLFGEIGRAGITMPKQLDFAGILDLVLQVLGITYTSIRDRVVKRFGEPVVARMEQGVDVFKTLASEGVAGLWTWIREKVADLENLVVGKLKEYIIERVVKAGISYIVALLNPVAAFIKACQGIYQIVMFIVERAKQIAEFVESILDSIAAIAQGNVGAAVERIERALANGLSLAIGFLARLANLGALSEKVRSIIALVRRPITRAVDQIVMGAASVYRRTIGPAVALAQGKVQAGREWAKGKLDAGKAWAQRKVESAKVRLTGRDLAPDETEEAKPEPQADEEAERPRRIAADSVEVAPDETHTLFAQLAGAGQVDIGISSSPQLVTDLVRHFQPRIATLPTSAPARPPKGGRQGDQPRIQAESAATRILRRAGKLEVDFEQDVATGPIRRPAGAKEAAKPPPYRAPPRLTSDLVKLGDDVQTLLRLFYAYDKPRFARVEDEPRGGQKLTARVFVQPLVTAEGEEILPERGRRGLDPTRTGGPGFDVLAPDPHLEAPTRGPVREGAVQSTRGVVHRYAVAWESGQREIVVRSWATGGTPSKGSNASHTEMQFFHWLSAQGEEFHQRVTGIELRSVLSPCGGCTSLLSGISRLLRNRPREAPRASLVVFWDRVYADDEGNVDPAAATRSHHVGELTGAGWFVHGPRP